MCTLNGKDVTVTGGSFGIGRAAALSIAESGAKLLITARRAPPLAETAADQAGLVADATAPDNGNILYLLRRSLR